MDLWGALLDAMRRRRNPRISSADVDQLIAGGSPGPGQHGLAALLDAVRSPASEQELAGERAAVAAFVAAYRGAAPTGTPKRRSRVRIPSLARAATVKAVAGVAVLVVGGTALAAETGSLPRAAQHHAHSLFSGLGVPPPAPESPPSAGAKTGGPVPPSGPGAVVPAPGSNGPVPDVAKARELCRAWQAERDKKHDKPMTADSRRVLAAMAGKKSDIPDFCAPYLAGQSAPPPPTPAPGVTPDPGPANPGTGPGNGNGPGNGPESAPGHGNPPGNATRGSKGSDNGKPGGNNTANAVVDGRAGPHA